MKNNTKRIFLLLLIPLIGELPLFSQSKTMEDLEVALTLKICEYVKWPVDTNQNFTIAIFTSNQVLRDKFISITTNYRIKNKKIRILVLYQTDSIPSSQALFIDEAYPEIAQKLIPVLSKRNILLFTCNYKISKDILFNLLPNHYKGSITFEFNRTNLIFEGFDIENEIIELRGSEIDIREMYQHTKLRLELEENKVQNLQKKLDIQKVNIDSQNKKITNLNTFINSLSVIIDSQTYAISDKEKILLSLKDLTKNQEKNIEKNLWVINNQQLLINSVNTSLQNQNEKITNHTKELDKLTTLIAEKQRDIAEKDAHLAEKDVLINFKNNLIYLLMAMTVLIVTVVFLILRAFKTNRKAKIILTKQKIELEATLNKLTHTQTKLIQSEKMASLGILTSGIAHEINNPVNFISSGIRGLQKINSNIIKVLQAYRETYATSKTNTTITELENNVNLPFLLESSEKLISNIQTGVDRTVSIIKSLKSFARSDEEEKKSVNIHESIDLALTILYNQYKYKIEIIKQYGNIPLINCYPGKINQVFMNLLVNSIQAIPEKGAITITSRLIDNFIEISVKDTGTGIPKAIKEKIFDPFFTTKEIGKGTGMGLSIVFSIIEEHNGTITVNSEPENGSEFIIKLPTNTSPLTNTNTSS